MKTIQTLPMIILLALTSLGTLHAQMKDSVEMGPGYENDVFYSMENGITGTAPRANWDIAFRTNIMSSGIMINGGSGVKLYTWPNGKISDWEQVDTAGLYQWKEMNNSLKNWEEGAFMAFAGNHPDYGWGVYNSTTHKLKGDSIFIIQLTDESFRKLAILEKDSPKNTYTFRYANLDGSGDTTITLNCNTYNTKAFIAYSIVNNLVVDREPEADQWDMLFTKYVDKIYMGPEPVNYPVTGILTNEGVYVARVQGEEETTFEDYSSVTFDSADIHVIGRDWKEAHGMPPVYTIVDSLLYFISDVNGNIYKLYFNDFESGFGGNGKFVFTKKLLKSASVEDNQEQNNMLVYPNPATHGILHILVSSKQSNNAKIQLVDLNGRTIESKSVQLLPALNHYWLDIPQASGIYLIRLITDNNITTRKISVIMD